jgi:hypothetical protein
VWSLADLHFFRENALAKAVDQEGRLAVQAAAADGVHKAADQRRGEWCFENHRYLTGLDLARAETRQCSPGGVLTDRAPALPMACGSRAIEYQSSRCMRSFSPAIIEHDR